MSTGRHSYGGPSDGHVVLNPIPPSSSSSTRGMGGAGGTGGAVSKGSRSSKATGGGGAAGGNGRHSLPAAASTTTSSQLQAAPPNHQRSHDNNIGVGNIPHSNTPATTTNTTSNNINKSSSAPQHPYNQQHISQLIHQQNVSTTPVPSNTRKSKHAQTHLEVISVDSDTDDNRNGTTNRNMSSQPQPSGPSLAGAASKNRSLLGQHYDPVRPYRASASPAISSLIDPQPAPSNPSYRNIADNSSAPPIIKPDVDSPPFAIPIDAQTPAAAPVPAPAPTVPGPPVEKTQSTKETAANRSPKASKAKRLAAAAAPPPSSNASSVPTPPGSGLLSGIDPLGNDSMEKSEIPTIYIHVPLNGETNKYVNFAKLAEEKYGPLVINRHLKERMKLGDMSGDEMMVDGSESESNIEDRTMSGMDVDSNVETKTAKTKRKRKIQDSYDSHDPFIDDSEMLYEEQAATTKDGFFVYSGPLIPQGEKPQVERADGTVKRGRGGRARGSARGGGAPKAPATRKPRATKKEKQEKLEKEKEERERLERSAANGQLKV